MCTCNERESAFIVFTEQNICEVCTPALLSLLQKVCKETLMLIINSVPNVPYSYTSSTGEVPF